MSAPEQTVVTACPAERRRPAEPLSTLAAYPSEGKFMKFPPVGLGDQVRLWWGKLRRCFLGRVMKGYTRRRHALRMGECARCGACCQLGRVCPWLTFDAEGLACCEKYNQPRDPSCKLYPTTESDLRDRDIIMPERKCGFHFADKK